MDNQTAQARLHKLGPIEQPRNREEIIKGKMNKSMVTTSMFKYINKSWEWQQKYLSVNMSTGQNRTQSHTDRRIKAEKRPKYLQLWQNI